MPKIMLALILLCIVPSGAYAANAKMVADFAYGPDPKQAMDIFIPSKPVPDMPVIVMVHGGAWKIGDKENSGVADVKASHFLPKGFVFVTINYRLLPTPVSEQASDVREALAAVRLHAKEWGASPDKIILMGHSAGAHLVALVSAAGNLPILGTVVLDSAVLDVASVMERRHMGFYDDAFGDKAANWASLSPIDQLQKGAKPMMLVCSSQRRDKPCAAAEKFALKAKTLGVRTKVDPQDLSHEEINKTLGLPSAYTSGVDSFINSILK